MLFAKNAAFRFNSIHKMIAIYGFSLYSGRFQAISEHFMYAIHPFPAAFAK
jgi:hypothetical protein